MSTVRDLREEREELWWSLSLSLLDDEECLEDEEDECLLLLDDLWEEECLEDDEDECLEDEDPVGTSRTFSSLPVVGSVVDFSLGLWATWYPSMM
jgi:hypothetical protein